jgi:hypothetical protein
MNPILKMLSGTFLAAALIAPPASAQWTPPKYLIITSEQLSVNPTLNTFVRWKKLKGYDVSVVSTKTIPHNYPNTTATFDDIVYYMRHLGGNYPSYLLIVGDNSAVPSLGYFTGEGGVTDIPYACLDDDWLTPDLYYGRLPVSSDNDLNIILTKIIAMDRTPPVSTMYDKALVASTFENSKTYCETADAVACYFEQTPGLSCTRAITNPNGDAADASTPWPLTIAEDKCTDYSLLWNKTTPIDTRIFTSFLSKDNALATISNSINQGVACVFHRDHGEWYGWGQPPYTNVEADQLTNGTNLPLVISLDCSTGQYWLTDYPGNIMRSWLFNPNGGAYGCISATDVTPTVPNEYMAHGIFLGLFPDYLSFINNPNKTPVWDNLLPSPSFQPGTSFKLGPMLNNAKLYLKANYGYYGNYIKDLFAIYHVFGDPEMEARLRTPQTINVTYPKQIALGTRGISVTPGEAGLLMCVYGNTIDDKKSTMVTSYTGTAYFGMATPVSDLIHVTITGYNKRPHEGIVQLGTGLTFTSPTGNGKGFVADDGCSHFSGAETSDLTFPSGSLRFGHAGCISDQGNLFRASVSPNSGTFLDNETGLKTGLIFRGPDGKVQMHISTSGTVSVRNQLTAFN